LATPDFGSSRGLYNGECVITGFDIRNPYVFVDYSSTELDLVCENADIAIWVTVCIRRIEDSPSNVRGQERLARSRTLRRELLGRDAVPPQHSGLCTTSSPSLVGRVHVQHAGAAIGKLASITIAKTFDQS
jgi:hypothetical protein